MMAILTCHALRHFLVRVRASVARVRAVQSGLKHTFYVDKPFVFLQIRYKSFFLGSKVCFHISARMPLAKQSLPAGKRAKTQSA